MKKILFLCCVFGGFSAFVLNTSNGISNSVRSKLSIYANKDWPEKIYVHTDKPYYALNEDLWFSAYLVNGIDHSKSSKSYVTYVELINETDSIVASRRLYIDQLSSAGHFKINENWLPGNYILRAYTNYMRNESPETFYQKTIPIISLNNQADKSKNLDTLKTPEAQQYDEKPNLQFFPEGGYLVNGINSKVAIKIKESYFQDSELPIEIVDSEGYLMTELSISEFGLGDFYINPKANKDYFANLTLNGKIYQYRLPEALREGYGLNINFKNSELLIEISTTKKSGLKNTYIVIHQRGLLLYDKVETSNKTRDVISLDTRNLQDGVTHITLFNDEGKPVCERLVFIDNPTNDVSVVIQKNKEEYESREKVVLDLQITDSKGTNLSGNLSMSVRNLDAIPKTANATNIKTWLLLNSDLRGKIENPAYFFSEGEASKKKYLLDLVMMTNGWRRFTWPDLLKDRLRTNIFNIEKGIHISGTTKALESPNNGVSTINTITFLGNRSLDIQSVNSSKRGKFNFGPYVFYDSIPTIIQSRIVDTLIKKNHNSRDVLITLDSENLISPDITRHKDNTLKNSFPTVNDDFSESLRYIRDLNSVFDNEGYRLDKVILNARKKDLVKEREKEMEERSLFKSPTHRLDVESDSFLSKTPAHLIFQRFPSIRVTNVGVYYRGEPTIVRFNNMNVDIEFIKSLHPVDISFIEFYFGADASIYRGATGGVIEIYGKIGADRTLNKTPRKPGIINFISQGFDSTMEFYSPDYSKDLDHMTRTDIRVALHWEPKVRLDNKNPSTEVSFYTCDMKGNYIIELEGVLDSGIPIHKTSHLYVN